VGLWGRRDPAADVNRLLLLSRIPKNRRRLDVLSWASDILLCLTQTTIASMSTNSGNRLITGDRDEIPQTSIGDGGNHFFAGCELDHGPVYRSPATSMGTVCYPK